MPGLEITDCRVRPCDQGQGDEKLCAFATITLNNAFVICDLKVINGNDGIFVAMPSRRRKDGSFRDIAHPLNAETRQHIERVVLREYLNELERSGEQPPAPPAHLSIEELRAKVGAVFDEAAAPPDDLYRPAAMKVLADLATPNGTSGPRPPHHDTPPGGTPMPAEIARELASAAAADETPIPAAAHVASRAGDALRESLRRGSEVEPDLKLPHVPTPMPARGPMAPPTDRQLDTDLLD
jgi:stage V sporulation protein G